MAAPAAEVYENLLKGAYTLNRDGKVLAVTDGSCYLLPEATAWLTANLPPEGDKKTFLSALAGLGLNEPEAIFKKLLDIGALQVKPAKTWKTALWAALSPRFRLLPAQWQEAALNAARVSRAAAGKLLKAALWPAGLGALWGLWLMAGGGDRLLPVSATLPANGVVVFLLVVLGGLVHELGHSLAAYSSGIGLRPIGFSFYLIYPVFYTNVSGIEKLPLRDRIFVDSGGFILQSVYALGLLLVSAATGFASPAETVKWIMAIVLFNLNPFLKTDGYWLYRDTLNEYKGARWMRAVHALYLVAFVAFSAYFLWFVFRRAGLLWSDLGRLWAEPAYFFSGGYRVILGAYFILVGLTGGLRRFKEGRQEFRDLFGAARPPAAAPQVP